ncbi:dephospho-CoA kinase [Fodinisporobacter ferrooxydans]|uniref:Dephospho-CoA kinase n=1 Tax=Fodinisporobacter ferrooxydans TaxID=2901836 RepID=A0ABY4CQ91_9BACL|nr:dephospho-CoA kinase [Alicyclobacillaceae bacterium MYW30-H2]
MIVGLTGGIASGKSTVSHMFRKLGAHIVDADVMARRVVEKGRPALQEIVHAFGPGILLEDGTLNRTKLGEIVFREEQSRKRLNEIVHPRVREEVQADTTTFLQSHPDGIVIHDIPLLFESKLEHTVQAVIVVYVSEEVQRKRLMERNNLTAEEANRRIAAQMPLREKVQRADYKIDNEGTLEQTERQANQIWNLLQKQGRRS